MANPILLIIVEDEPIILLDAEQLLQDAGFSVLVASNGEKALSALNDKENAPVGIVTDIRLVKGMAGWEVARHARERYPAIAVV